MKNCIFLSFLSFLPLSMMAYGGQLTIPEGVLLSSGVQPEFVAKFAFFIALLLLWTTLVGKILKMILHIPIIAGQIIAGVFLGPSFFNIKSLSIFAMPFEVFDRATGVLYSIASSDIFIIFVLLLSSAFTVPYLLWIAGHETDIKDMLKVGFTAVTAGVLGVMIPVFSVVLFLFYCLGSYFSLVQSIGLGLIFAATSVSIPIAMLFAREKMHLRSSKATLGAAIVDDILSIILLSIFFICLQSGFFGEPQDLIVFSSEHTRGIVEAIVYMLVSFAVIALFGYFIIPPLVRLLKDKSQTHLISSVANGIMFLYFAFAELVGHLAGITGAYFAGFFHRMGDNRHTAEKVISPFVNAILLPIFLASIGLQVNIQLLSSYQWIIVVLLTVVAIFSKVASCYVSSFLSNILGRRKKNRWRSVDSYLFGSSMSARGEVGLVIATILNGAQVISYQHYIIAVVVIVLTTIISPIMLSVGFYWLDKVEKKEGVEYKDIIVNVGLFDVIGTTQMFNIIVGRVERSDLFKNSIIRFSEGRRIANLEEHNVKIIYSPDDGIVFEGNERDIKKILKIVKSSIMSDVERIS